MTKIHLKRTPAEEADRARRKAMKAARKSAKKSRPQSHPSDNHESDDADVHAGGTRNKRRKPDTYSNVANEDEDIYGPLPPQASSSANKPDYEAIRAELEEARFREKMWGALEDDERLDAMEARLNDFAHVPHRWRGDDSMGSQLDDGNSMDPRHMDDDEYAEWIRQGMWRKKHAREYEEEALKKAEKAARRAREKEIKAESARLEKIAEETRKRKRREKDRRRDQEYREEYDRRWKELLQASAQDIHTLAFEDIPWPLAVAHASLITVEHLTPEAISAFLIPTPITSAPTRDTGITVPTDDSQIKEKKEKLRETMLRFHPDKFEGRLMRRVVDRDKDRVKEAVGQIARALNTLMGD
ncbi:hypothetical protein BV22DRAFT_274774 [Leucogyrophana mollusca]|uniref:Uncharacterized protein n=1 Tax=Leucogyrophana mollusca TaxID=85980 RepID=A0ACB8BP80_9AGAM|nr:hypothetical protein BV22DRAFT_274774 [Leucogyrophana mollusca]